ncbi:anti-sigma factor [Chitinophagaceae bacterium LB-8]|uniref:Anti-sigma factor n=1 Tax=Paraflavisolibacter caeni TaxID=2982496 RepID=A0A9X2XYA0_9BACT|nr:anti-sigma factor [Paraflavisolibacter caeni]MCU7550817.1 anti-sigma factor [Paraflavisolibacter caeni]
MDLSCIISSGDLELYLLGMLPEEEAYKIEQLAVLLPEVRLELDRISGTIEDFARTSERNPSAGVKANLMERLRSLNVDDHNAGAEIVSLPVNEAAEANNTSTDSAIIRPMKRYNWLQAASMIGLLLALGIVILLASQNRENKKELVSLEQRVNSINRNLVEQQRLNLAASEMLKMYENDKYIKIRLLSVPGKPKAAAQVFWDTDTKEVYIADISLPQTPSHKQYQLWAIVGGKPVDAGVMDIPKHGVQKMKVFQKADAFAITLERKGGSPTPTLEEMYVMGKPS